MEPVTTTIVAALALGAAAGLKDTASQAITDAYAGLRKLIQDRYKKNEDVTDAVDYLVKKPEAESRQQELSSALEAAGANNDQELHQLAQQLLAVLNEQPNIEKSGGQKVEQNVTGHGNNVSGSGDVTAGNITINL